MPIVAGGKLRVSDLTGSTGGGAVASGNTVQMAGDVTVNNTTTLADATGLSVAVLASATYKIDGWIMYTCTSTPDFKIGWSTPASTTGYWVMTGYGRDVSPAADTGLGSVHMVADIGSTLTPAGDSTGTARLACSVRGFITTTQAGTLVLRFAQRTANASNTVAKTGSWLDVVRVS
jgi:acetamidase/formamidase